MSMIVAKKGRYFESQEENEEVLLVLRKHWIILFSPFVTGVLIIAITFALFYLMRATVAKLLPEGNMDPFIAVVMGLTVLFTILYVFIAWLIKYYNLIILTNIHLVEIQQLSVFNRKISVLSLDHIEDVTSEQKGFIRTIFDFGNVDIQTAGEMANFYFRNFKDPEWISQEIMEAKERHEKLFHPVPEPATPLPPETPPTPPVA